MTGLPVITIDPNGDITSILDEETGLEMLSTQVPKKQAVSRNPGCSSRCTYHDAALGSIEPGGTASASGAAVQHTAQLLVTFPAISKLLLNFKPNY